jgi:phosphoenolpyruvate carboxykinase (GTP)
MIERCSGQSRGRTTAIGVLPTDGELNLDQLSVSDEALEELLRVDNKAWRVEMEAIGEYLSSFGERCPAALEDQRRGVVERLG